MLNYICHVDRHTQGCSALPGSPSPAELLDWGYWGRPEGLGSLLTPLTAAVATFGVLNAFLLANSEVSGPLHKGLERQSQRVQVHTKTSRGDPSSTTGKQMRLGDIRGTAVRICGSDSSTRSRFSQGSQSHGLSNKGNRIRSAKCLCEEQNCAKRLKLSHDTQPTL